MIQSMTGYGKACAQCGLRKVHVEIKSLNSKSLDLSTRIAPLYREKEMEIRTAVAQRLERGKVDFTLWVEKDESPTGCLINGSMVKHYLKQIEEISQANGIAAPTANAWDILVRLPELTYPAVTEELAAEEWTAVQGVIGEALDRLVEFRTQEGAALERKFTEKLDNITALLASIEPYEKARVEKIRARLEELLERFDLAKVRKQYAYTLSGGERRKLEIARALVRNPKILMLDEPFAGVDPVAVRDIQDVVEQLRKEGYGILITDHNARETLKIVDRAYMLFSGTVFREGPVDTLVNDPEVRRLYLTDEFTM